VINTTAVGFAQLRKRFLEIGIHAGKEGRRASDGTITSGIIPAPSLPGRRARGSCDGELQLTRFRARVKLREDPTPSPLSCGPTATERWWTDRACREIS